MSRARSLIIAGLLLALGAALVWVFAAILGAAPGERLSGLAADNVPASGVTNPVTAVLLNYRAYDTLLELAVLLAALLGIWSAGAAPDRFPPAGFVLAATVGWLVPVLILAAGYLLWAGAHAPGGAFQAGALLGGAGVSLALAGHWRAGLPPEAGLRLLTVGGVAVFALAGAATAAAGAGFLTYRAGTAKWLILGIETAASAAIGATLAAAFLGGRPPKGKEGRG